MNLRKILFTFFVIFVVIDAFLVYSWVHLQQSVISAPTTTSVIAEMEHDGITTVPLSGRQRSGSFISAEDDVAELKSHLGQLKTPWNGAQSGNTIVVNLTSPVNVGVQRAHQIKMLNKIVANPADVIFGHEYRYDDVATRVANTGLPNGQQQVVYLQKATGERVFAEQGQIVFTLNQQGDIQSYQQSHLTEIKHLQDTSTLISAREAVKIAYQYNEVPNNAHIISVKLVYTKLTQVDEDQIYVPTWQISIKDASGDIDQHNVNALNGTLLK